MDLGISFAESLRIDLPVEIQCLCFEQELLRSEIPFPVFELQHACEMVHQQNSAQEKRDELVLTFINLFSMAELSKNNFEHHVKDMNLSTGAEILVHYKLKNYLRREHREYIHSIIKQNSCNRRLNSRLFVVYIHHIDKLINRMPSLQEHLPDLIEALRHLSDDDPAYSSEMISHFYSSLHRLVID